jgi:hypothetical protein
MDASKLIPVMCLALFIALGINAAIYAALRRGKEAGQIDLLRRAVGRARRPWGEEDDNLKELSQRVAGLKELEEKRKNTPDQKEERERHG